MLTYASRNHKVKTALVLNNSQKVRSFLYGEVVSYIFIYDYFSYTTTECSCSILTICLNISKAACGWNAGYQHAVRIKSTRTEMTPTYYFVTSLVYTSTDPFQEGTATVPDPKLTQKKNCRRSVLPQLVLR